MKIISKLLQFIGELTENEDKGYRNGVAKNLALWPGISIKIWIPQAANGHQGFFKISQTMKNANAKKIRLWVIE